MTLNSRCSYLPSAGITGMLYYISSALVDFRCNLFLFQLELSLNSTKQREKIYVVQTLRNQHGPLRWVKPLQLGGLGVVPSLVFVLQCRVLNLGPHIGKHCTSRLYVYTCGNWRTAFRGQFFPSAVWVPGIALRWSSGWAASMSTR